MMLCYCAVDTTWWSSALAPGAAGVGARVAIVEQHLFGGDCLNVGCVPSKALIRCARAAHEVRR